MAWVKIDDHFDEHPKLAAVGPIGWGVWLAGLAYCNRNLTDGFIPRPVAESIGGKWRVYVPTEDGREQVWRINRSSGMVGQDMDTEWAISLLVQVGLWEEVEGGYRVHDYSDYQPSKDEVLALRRVRAEAGSKGGRASAQAKQAKSKAKAKQPPSKPSSKTSSKPSSKNAAKVNPVPDPVPDPDPVPEPEPQGALPPNPRRAAGAAPRGNRPSRRSPLADPEARSVASAIYDAMAAAGSRPSDADWFARACAQAGKLTPEARGMVADAASWALSQPGKAGEILLRDLSACRFGALVDQYRASRNGSAQARASPALDLDPIRRAVARLEMRRHDTG